VVAVSSRVQKGYVTLNLADEFLLQNTDIDALFEGVDTVLHLASITTNATNVHSLSLLFDNTIIGKNIGEIGKRLNVATFINLSSMSVYPNIDGVFDENSLVNPAPNSDYFYGLAKYNAEVLLDFLFKNTNTRLLHLRTAMVYADDMPESRIIPMMQREWQTEKTITVFGNGKRILNLIHKEKLVYIILKMLESSLSGIYNVGDEVLSTEALALRICDNHQAAIIRKNIGNAYQFHLDTTKLKNTNLF
jgi:nucleoside-diphosphate-sugar epimerase